ncbi:MAG: hypothetical protein WAU88_11665 [Candidatus Zixiibacteriota bacterium]
MKNDARKVGPLRCEGAEPPISERWDKFLSYLAERIVDDHLKTILAESGEVPTREKEKSPAKEISPFSGRTGVNS